jgi:hypothetical protein
MNPEDEMSAGGAALTFSNRALDKRSRDSATGYLFPTTRKCGNPANIPPNPHRDGARGIPRLRSCPIPKMNHFHLNPARVSSQSQILSAKSSNLFSPSTPFRHFSRVTI